MPKIKDPLSPFKAHGVSFTGSSGDNEYGYCPFSKKENKFYVNRNNQLWDSKVAGVSGNLSKFLELIFKKIYQPAITELDYARIAKDRNLPVEAFKLINIGKYGSKYIIPMRDHNNRYIDLRGYKFGFKLMSTKGCHSGLWGMEELLTNKDLKIPIFMCEGEWDGIAMKWLLHKTKRPGIVIAVPGASMFPKEWWHLFNDRTLYILYDNDSAGEEGEQKVFKTIKDRVRKIRCLHWDEKFNSGFDIRDFIGLEAVKNKRPLRCFIKLLEMLKDFPRKQDEEIIDQIDAKTKLPDRDISMNWDKLMECIQSWLKIDDFDPIKVAISIVLSNFIDGDPVWMFLVACPGVGKSEMLGMFKQSQDVYTTSSITPNALISGAISYKGKEPSLLPKLDGKTLCIKDFSTIQTMRDTERDSLLGILRDAYDGSAGKVFGTGESKHFESKFSILAGVTPSIYDLEHQFSSLGERFLKIFIGEYLEHKDQVEIIEKAMENVGHEVKMRDEFSAAMYNFVENTKEFIARNKDKPITLDPETEKKIAILAAWCSRMKGTVNRDKYERDIITNKAYSEVGTRTGKQLKRLMLCFPTVIYSRKEDESDYAILKRVALDSISAKREDIFRSIYMSCEDKSDTVEVKQVVHLTKYGYSTALRTVDDLVALGAVDRIGHKRPYQYRISEIMYNHTKKCQLYLDTKSKNRPFRSQYFKKNEEEKED